MKRVILAILMVAALAVSVPMQSDARKTGLSETAYLATIEIGEQYGICPEILQALIERESSGNPNAENSGCKGLCQINEKYHKDRMERLGVTDIYDEYGNILVAADYLMELADEYGEISLVLDIYNGNSKAFSNYESGIVSSYAESILERSAELERQHGK